MNKLSQNIAAAAIGVIVFVCVLGTILLAWDGADVPDVLNVAVGGGIGSLGTLLIKERKEA